MAILLSSLVAGTAQTGLTSPTYTVVSDMAPVANALTWSVTVLGGTQAGVTIASVASPFRVTFFKPAVLRQPGVPNPSTGKIPNIPNNVWRVLIHKGATPASGQLLVANYVDCKIGIAAGSETFDGPNVRAMLSFFIGVLAQVSAGLGDTTVSGVM